MAADRADDLTQQPRDSRAVLDQSPRGRWLAWSSVPLSTAALGACFWVVHAYLVRWMIAHKPRDFAHEPLPLGSVTPRMPAPLYAVWERPRFDAWLLPALAAVGGLVLLVGPLAFGRGARVPTRLLLPLAAAALGGVALSVSMIDGYRAVPDGRRLPAFEVPYTHADADTGRPMEFYADTAAVRWFGPAGFLRRFATPEVFPYLSAHGQTHPPGPALFLWLVGAVFGPGLLAASLATIVFTGLAVVSVYGLARDLAGETTARAATLLFLLTPSVALFTATSMDGPAMVFSVGCVWLFHRALTRGPFPYAPLAGLLLACACFMTYATVGTVLVLLILGGYAFWRAVRRDSTTAAVAERATPSLTPSEAEPLPAKGDGDSDRSVAPLDVIRTGLLTVLTPCVLFAALRAATGFNLLDAALLSVRKDAMNLGTGYETFGRYFHLSLGNLVAFYLGVGVAATAAWLHEVVRTWRGRGRTAGGPTAWGGFILASAVVPFALAFSTLFTMEVERIWIFLAPLVVIPAAKLAVDERRRTGRGGALVWLAGLLALQLLASEMFLDTFW